jgi:hypothetical protein
MSRACFKTSGLSRLLKKAHLPRCHACALAAAYLEYASLGAGYPSVGWVTPPCIWTSLSSLTESKFFSILLAGQEGPHSTPPEPATVPHLQRWVLHQRPARLRVAERSPSATPRPAGSVLN